MPPALSLSPMEHFVFEADEPHETVFACRESVLKADWQQFDGLTDFVPLKTPWLGFDHDAMPLGAFAEYPNTAGFDESKLWNANFRESHLDFKELSGTEIGRRVVALFQAWLYYGLLESVVGKKILVSYLMRQDIDGKEYLYSRNLHFCLQAKHLRFVQTRKVSFGLAWIFNLISVVRTDGCPDLQRGAIPVSGPSWTKSTRIVWIGSKKSFQQL